jgi:hypothetical protein
MDKGPRALRTTVGARASFKMRLASILKEVLYTNLRSPSCANVNFNFNFLHRDDFAASGFGRFEIDRVRE